MSIGMRQRRCLVEVTLQGQKFQGAITVYASEDRSELLAVTSYITYLRRSGIWESITEDEEGEKIYHAPTKAHVKFIDFIPLNSQKLTFPQEEIEADLLFQNSGSSLKRKKRRTTGEAALNKRQKVTKTVQSKAEKLLPIAEYFKISKAVKRAAKDLKLVYQVIRYRIEQIKNDGIDEESYDVEYSKSDGMKMVKITKRIL